MRRAFVLPAIAAILLAACIGGQADRTLPTTPGATEVIVDTRDVAVGTFGGFGAEWDPYEFSSRSAVPQLVKDRIRFMQLAFVRVRMFASWYSDVDNHYDFSNEAIHPLYELLDAAKANGTDVILTEWGQREWSGDPWPIDDPRYAEAVADGVDHLVRTRGYTNIEYLVITNEPDWSQPSYATWRAAIGNVHRELAARGLLGQVSLMGPDTCCTEDWWRPSLIDLGDMISAWDRHLYADPIDVRRGATEEYLQGVWDEVRALDPEWATKPFVLAESGFKVDKTTPAYAVDMVDFAIQATRAGTSMMSAWMLDDESYPKEPDAPAWDIWGMWSTRESDAELKPWFSTWSLLCRLVRPGSTLYLATQPTGIRALAARHPSTGTWTFVLVNRDPSRDRDVTVKAPGYGAVTYSEYLFDGIDGSGLRDANGFPVPVATGRPGDLGIGITVTIPANSVAYISADIA